VAGQRGWVLALAPASLSGAAAERSAAATAVRNHRNGLQARGSSFRSHCRLWLYV
jgi:hypothetical protein